MAFSKVLGVETFDYPFVKDENGKAVTIQVPEHRIRKVHWSAEVESGNSILIDSVETYEKEIKSKTPFKAAATQTMRTLIMVTSRIVAEHSAKENQAELNQ